MTTLAAFLLSITGSLAARVLLSLGFGFVTYTALTTIASSIVSSVTSSYNGMASTTLNILNLAGVGQGIGIILAAITTKAALTAIKKLRPV